MANWSEDDLRTLKKKIGIGVITYGKTTQAPAAKQLATALKAAGVKQPRQHPEHDAQAQFFDWCNQNAYRAPELNWFFAVPNGGFRHVEVGKMLKKEGVKSGVEDILFLGARNGYHFLAIEAKSDTGTVDKTQKPWHAEHQREGGKVVVAYGADEMIAAACEYLGIKREG